MMNFNYSYPTRVYFGAGSAKEAFQAELGKFGKTVMLTYGGVSVARENNVDFILAIGGGSVIDFQAHQIEHPLGAYTDCNHGQRLAVIQPAYYRHIVSYEPEKFTRFAKAVFDKDTAKDGISALENLIKECGLPTHLNQLYTKTEITAELLRKVADTSNIIKTGPRQLTKNEIYEILTECM